jgi:integrase
MFYTVCMNASKTESESERVPQWQKTPVANLVRSTASGTYYARARIKGKLIWKSLKTDRLAVGKLRLGDFLKLENHRVEIDQSAARGKMTFGDAVDIYKQRVEEAQHLKPGAKLYRKNTIEALLKSWPDLKNLDARKISANDCLHWASSFAEKHCPSFFNNTVGTLRQIIKITIDSGARYGNPADQIKKVKVRQKILKLPEHAQFLALVASVRSAGGGFSNPCGDLIEFFAYSGARKSEAARVFGSDCDLINGRISIKGDPETGTKNWEVRTVPMISDMRRLLDRIRSERGEAEWPKQPVMRVRECQKAIDSACKKLGINRFTHHDLRHLFATRCIESGVDIPTVSRWLGHKDGGALAMKTYGHLRDLHSTSMAQKVIFSEPVAATATNIVALPIQPETPMLAAQDDGSEKKAIAKAKAKYKYPWWASNDPLEVFWGQVNEPFHIVPLEKYHDAARVAMDREVFQNEFDDPQGLIDEFAELVTAETLERLSTKLQRRNRSGAEMVQNAANP